MNDIIKSATVTVIVLTLAILVPKGFDLYNQAQEEARMRQNCEQMKAFRAEIFRRMNSGEKVSDLEKMGAYEAGRMCR